MQNVKKRKRQNAHREKRYTTVLATKVNLLLITDSANRHGEIIPNSWFYVE